MLTQNKINIAIAVAVVVIIAGISWLAISVNNRLSYLEGKVS